MSNLSGLVVTSEDRDSILKAYLEGYEESDGLDRVVPSVNVIAHEEVVCVGGLSTNLEQLAQVVELAVDITANGNWGTHLLHVRFIYKNFLCLKRNGKIRDRFECWVGYCLITTLHLVYRRSAVAETNYKLGRVAVRCSKFDLPCRKEP